MEIDQMFHSSLIFYHKPICNVTWALVAQAQVTDDRRPKHRREYGERSVRGLFSPANTKRAFRILPMLLPD